MPHPIRNVRAARSADFDERLWPIGVAMLILAGCVAGIVAAASSFDDPRLLYNGWARLGGVAALVPLLLGVLWLQGKMARRLQLCIVLSLLLHLWLTVFLHEKHLRLAALPNQRSNQPAVEQPPQDLLPTDYHWQVVEPPPKFQQVFEEPIETAAPESFAAETSWHAAVPPVMPAEEKPPAHLEPPGSPPPEPAVLQRRADREPELAQSPQPAPSRQPQRADVSGNVAEPLAPAGAAAVQPAPLRDETAWEVPRQQALSRPTSMPREVTPDISVPSTSAAPAPGEPRRAEPTAAAVWVQPAGPVRATLGPVSVPEVAPAEAENLAAAQADATGQAGPAAIEPGDSPVTKAPAAHPAPRASLDGGMAAVIALAGSSPFAAGPAGSSIAPAQATPPARQARIAEVVPAAAIPPTATALKRATVAVADAVVEADAEIPFVADATDTRPGGQEQSASRGDITLLSTDTRLWAAGPQRRQAASLPSRPEGNALGSAPAASPTARPAGAPLGPRRLPRETGLVRPLAAEWDGSRLEKTNTAVPAGGLAEIITEQPLAAGTDAEPDAAQPLAPSARASEKGVRTIFHPGQYVQPFPTGKIVLTPFSPGVEIPGHRPDADREVAYLLPRQPEIERTRPAPSVDGSVSEPTRSYQHRDPGRRSEAVEAHGGGGTERGVEMGLDFFARIQFPDGHWSLHKLPEGVKASDPALGQMEADAAATGLALLTYLGAGYTHLDNQHRAVIGHAVGWLVANQKPSGELFTGGSRYARFYSHGIAAIALCEAYGMTQDPNLREPARKAADFIIHTQHPSRGGWRYDLRPDTGQSTETDTSVTGWQLLALRSAQMAGLEVPAETLQKIDAWLDTAAARGAPGHYVYNPFADRGRPEQLDGLKPSLAMTSEAMLMRMYLGRGRDNPQVIEGAAYLRANLPEMGPPERPLRDCYYWYYATQAMFQMQGDYWAAWNGQMRPLLLGSQTQQGELAGSWHPGQPVPDRWGAAGGRVYVSAIHLLVLEVYYRHLPLFQGLGK